MENAFYFGYFLASFVVISILSITIGIKYDKIFAFLKHKKMLQEFYEFDEKETFNKKVKKLLK